jgi:hypothetical protein
MGAASRASEATAVYLRGLPTDLVREAKAAAARRGSTLAKVVAEALGRALAADESSPRPVDSLDRDMTWYERNRARLAARYRGEYVAIVDLAVVDHDEDFEALAGRVFDRLGVRSVFMPRVAEIEARPRLRSPRRVRR